MYLNWVTNTYIARGHFKMLFHVYRKDTSKSNKCKQNHLGSLEANLSTVLSPRDITGLKGALKSNTFGDILWRRQKQRGKMM